MKDLSSAQLSLILSLVESEKYQIADDIQSEDFDIDGKQSGLSRASFSALSARFWELSRIEELLTVNQTTTTTQNDASY
jgi:hypothetical protein